MSGHSAENDCPCHGLSNVPAWLCRFGGVHTKGVHHVADTPLMPVERDGDQWRVIPPAKTERAAR